MTPQTPYVAGQAPAQPEQPFTLQQMAPKRSRRVWPLLVLVAVLVLGGAGAAYALTRDGSAPAVDETAALITACRDEATKSLKSPASARFSDEEPVELGDRFHYIDGVVDSQNSFGATVRTKYRCKAEAIDGGWSVVRVEFSNWP